jgi:hypothetical protein
MAIVDVLLQNAYEDTQLLLKNDSLGDQLSVPRDVDFLLRTPDEEKARLVCSFINDNQYGAAKVQETNVLVVIHMPIQQNIICSVSALMACIAEIFKVEYDGWGSELRKST